MSSYYLNIVNDGSNSFTPTVRRNGTASSGGTALTLPSTMSGALKSLHDALAGARFAVLNDFVTNSDSNPSYYIDIVEDANGNKTATARRGGTASSGGTVLTLSPGVSTPTKSLHTAIMVCEFSALNDASLGN